MRAAVLIIVLAWAATPAFAWGPEGHAVVADIASAHLTPAASQQVAALLDGQPLDGVASWADEVRKSQGNGAWHFVNLGDDCSYVAARDCPQDQCVVAALQRQEQVLADASQPGSARSAALKYLVHFVGDIAQPLHTIGHGDKGGNDYQVSIEGRGTNLHKVWDSTIVQTLGHGAQNIAAGLTPDPGRVIAFTDVSQFDPAAWAQASCRLVGSASIYPPGHKIGQDYLTAHADVVREQLRKAGERLAATLNLALGQPAPTH